ncbi:MAG TPA: GtrA family protein [Patescibacteria group bacterium]|nr:GtrA family protein [Patescibacteria group bacterium]
MESQKSEGIVQFIKFTVVGVTNTLVDWVVFYLLINSMLSDQHSLAKVISFAVAVLNSYLWNTVWTFRKEYQAISANKSAVFVKFAVISLIGWGVNVYVYNFAAANISAQILNKDLLPLILASGSAVIVNFFGNKLWTYKQ